MDVDVLGAPYERHTIDLGEDDEGAVVATLVRRRTDHPGTRAVLYVHGFVDYFFQTHLADFFVERGWDFYAVDLRKYGRSLLPHQTPNFCRAITDYYPELDEAARIIREQDGHDTLLVNGHSTGGLVTSLWAHDRRAAGIVDGLFLNSPFFDFKGGWSTRGPGIDAIARLARHHPYRVFKMSMSPAYGHSLHAGKHGEWSYDLAWKPHVPFPLTFGWIGAIHEGQLRLRAGLEIPVPILLASSTASSYGRVWSEEINRTDVVLDVLHMAKWGPGLGRQVTMVRIPGGIHDLTLSAKPAREQLFTEADRWIRAHVGAAPPAAAAPSRTPAAPADPG